MAAKIQIAKFCERYTSCASCRSAATLVVTVVDAATDDYIGGKTTTCQRHRPTWARRLAAQFNATEEV